MEAALVLITPLVGFVGVLVGQVFVRGRELREIRLAKYLDWMRAARNLATWEGEEPAAGTFVFPQPGRLHAAHDGTSDLNLVASSGVSSAALAYLNGIADPRLKAAVASAGDPRQLITAFDDHMKPLRRAVVTAMRKDLIPWWQRGERRGLPRRTRRVGEAGQLSWPRLEAGRWPD